MARALLRRADVNAAEGHLDAAGQDGAARAALEHAVWHFDSTLGAEHWETRAALELLATLK